jgi:OmcA/MtrC family decaheme c-type cytochrome
MRAQVGWPTVDYNVIGILWDKQPGQPFNVLFVTNGNIEPGVSHNADHSFTKTATTAIPDGARGSGVVMFEGKPMLVMAGEGPDGSPGLGTVPVTTVARPFAITDSSPVARRSVVDIQKCDDCHRPLAMHAENRVNNSDVCAICHNPVLVANATFGNEGLLDEGTVDIKHMAHALHNGTFQTSVYGYDQGLGYPGKLSNCEGCHKPDTYYPLDPAVVQASSVLAGSSINLLSDDTAMSPTVSVCSGCHVRDLIGVINGTASESAAAHMVSQGGSFNLTKNAAGQVVGPVESCSVCHGPGRTSDVKLVHDIASNRYN